MAKTQRSTKRLGPTRWNVVSADEYEGPVDKLPKLPPSITVEEECDNGSESSDPEEMQQGRINFANRVKPTRANKAPDNRR